MEAGNTPQMKPVARETKRSSPFEGILRTTKRLMRFHEDGDPDVIEGTQQNKSVSDDSLVTHPSTSPVQEAQGIGEMDLCGSCGGCSSAISSAIENALAAAIGEHLSKISDTVREGQERLNQSVQAITDKLQTLETSVRTVHKRQEKFEQDVIALDNQLAGTVKRVSKLDHGTALLSNSVEDTKTAQKELAQEITQIQSTISNARPAPVTSGAAVSAPRNGQGCALSTGVTVGAVQEMIAQERMKTEVRNNVIISPLPESDDEDLDAVLRDLVPDLAEFRFEAVRLGSAKPKGGDRPWLVRVRSSEAGKRMLMATRNPKRGNERVYINHDLTLAERKQRKRLLPKFRGSARGQIFLLLSPRQYHS